MNNDYKKYGIWSRLFNWRKVYDSIISVNKTLEEEIKNLKNESLQNLEQIANAKNLAKINDDLKEVLDVLKVSAKRDETKITKLETEVNSFEKIKSELSTKIEMLERNKSTLESDLSAKDGTLGEIRNELNKLQDKIFEEQKVANSGTKELLNIFKKTTGAAGKIAELRLEDLISKTAIDTNNWTNNLTVGSETVEFAIRAEFDKDKWVPVDSKLTGAFLEGEEIIVDEKLIKSVKTQSKKVTKYLGKKNTTQFGIMVLQSDLIYNEIYEHYPETLTNSIIENHVFIMSPSAFVQFSTAINKLAETFDKANKASQISAQLNVVIGHINKMSKAWEEAYKKLEIINNTHMPNIASSAKRVETLDALEIISEESDKK